MNDHCTFTLTLDHCLFLNASGNELPFSRETVKTNYYVKFFLNSIMFI